jgi:hypothetical protein
VFVDSAKYLKINAGSKIYTFGNYDDPYQIKGKILVQGRLLINGTPDSIVSLQGARLEQYWADQPGQWNGIHIFANSGQSEIKYTTIKGASTGIRIDSLPNNPADYNLIIAQSTIKHISSSAILGFHSKVSATNVLAYDCYATAFGFLDGGTIKLNHCTATSCTDAGLLLATNYLKNGNIIVRRTPMDITLTNCLLHDNYEECIGFGIDSSEVFNITSHHNLLKTKDPKITSTCIDCLINTLPEFTDADLADYTLDPSSPCVDAGALSPTNIDLKGNIRASLPDIGCYEL